MQVLTVEGVKAAARKAYQEGKLMAQHPDAVYRQCIYTLAGGYGCAIGVALSDETLAEIIQFNENCTVFSLLDRAVIAVVDGDRDAIGAIQGAHDDWCCDSRTWGEDSPSAVEGRNRFLELIGEPIPAETAQA